MLASAAVAIDLRLKILWAPLLTVALTAALAGASWVDRTRLAQQLGAVLQTRSDLEQVVARVHDYHERAVARAREAVLDPRLANRVPIVAYSAEHYAEDMDRSLIEARGALLRASVPGADQRWHADMQRAADELDRGRARLAGLGQNFAALLDTLDGEDLEVTNTALHDVEQSAAEIATDLRRTSAIVRRALDWQARSVTGTGALVPRWVWIALLPWIAIGTYLTLRPVSRLRRLALGDTVAPTTREERALAEREGELSKRIADNEALANQRLRDSERAAQNARRAEHELALLKLYNDNLVNSLRSAVVVTDPVGRVIGSNRAARELFGIAVDTDLDIDDHPLGKALKARNPAFFEERERAAAAKAVARYDGVPVAHEAGRERLIDVTMTPYVDESGATRGFIWVCDDVTDAVRLKGQLLASEHLAAVGRLSAQVAHEIRNPLSAIGLNAELLQDELDASLEGAHKKEAQTLLAAIAGEIERLTAVTESYLQMARLPRPALRDADLNQLVGDLFSMLSEEMKQAKIEVVLELASPAPHAMVDPGQLRQGMLNIVRNGREAMPEGGRLKVRTARDNGSAIIEVTDEGEGIPDELRGRVFEPFFSTKESGTGLGLSLTQQIVAEHGGSIAIAANAPKGTRVMLSLPTG
ncbi:MAG: PAS domain-containing sensor histidine kinase [Myxococcota bacterium]